jgi:hypothetical protein
MSDKDRALFDAFVYRGGFGAGGPGGEILAQHPQEIDKQKLIRYAEAMVRPRVSA